MSPPKAAVIGTGRSGTTYTAHLLRSNGVHAGHEQWWNAGNLPPLFGLDVDVSWLALPDIEQGVWSGPTVHVTRHPYDVVASLVGIRFWHPELAGEPFPIFARMHFPDLPRDPFRAACAWWVQWNQRCAAVADLTVKLDDLTDKETCREVGSILGFDLSPVPGLARDVNSRARAGLDRAAVRAAVGAVAGDFGYRW